ncbi:helix-turn-helix domain-containing protein [Shimia abyssi]|uniref:Helix-turn-helix domain-containing protein n=1 Tax=Shimia abyssi TaxID=1662395 RepID=A0A2P8FFM8_9RHOB|nr:helix-turn-helix domain-containing protein [Shimia abyssi]PSL20517.1 hypothetical protein CLV88_103164 [Shimia abyssi]
MAKRVNPMAVKTNTTYDVFEAARELNVTPATIRNWIKDGMEAMTSSKPYLILGSAIREYLRSKKAAARRPLKDEQLFCPSCRTGRKPVGMKVTLSAVSPKTDILKGVCQRCDGTATRMISHEQHQTFASIFRISAEPNSKD